MDDYYESVNGALSLKNSSSSYCNGTDFFISYIGNLAYAFHADYFDLKIWENGVDGDDDYFTDKITKPTCAAKGYTTHTCSCCGYSYKDTYTAKTEHKFGSWAVTAFPTCAGAGTETRTCSGCGTTETRSVDALGHNHSSFLTEPTCTKKGYTTHTCVCGDSYVDTYVEATGHSFGKWYTTKTSACTAKGEEKRECNNCDHFETRAIDKIAHTYTAIVTKPSCAEKGYTTYICVCGDSYVDTYINAIGHSYGEWYITKAPTCTATGTEEHKCSVCQHTETKTTVSLGHTESAAVAENKINATCTVEGRYDSVVYCSVCGHELSRKTNKIEQLDHSYVSTITPPTCTEQGYTTHTCACGDSYVDTYTEPAGHTFGNLYIIKVPTCTEVGEEKRECDNCNYFETNETEATGHSFTNYVSDGNATLEADGTKTALCDHGCGAKDTVTDEGSKIEVSDITSDKYTVSNGFIQGVSINTTVNGLVSSVNESEFVKVVDKNGNAVSGNTLLATGMKIRLMNGSEVLKEITVVVTGDTNGDGNISVTDMISVKAHILKKSTLTDAYAKAGDTNGDGSISITDFIQIKAHILGKSSLE